MFFVNFKSATGAIDSYCEAADESFNACPADCETLKFAAVFPQMFDTNYRLTMHVNLSTRQLEWDDAVKIPQALV